jgi:hypothetical protein
LNKRPLNPLLLLKEIKLLPKREKPEEEEEEMVSNDLFNLNN